MTTMIIDPTMETTYETRNSSRKRHTTVASFAAHRTNFNRPYNPPVAPGYQAPAPVQSSYTYARAESIQKDLMAAEELPFDEVQRSNKEIVYHDEDDMSEPGKIHTSAGRPAVSLPVAELQNTTIMTSVSDDSSGEDTGPAFAPTARSIHSRTAEPFDEDPVQAPRFTPTLDTLPPPPPPPAQSFRMAPPRVSMPSTRPYESIEDEPSALTGDFTLEQQRRNEIEKRRQIQDDDSLFDFERRRSLEEKKSIEDLTQTPVVSFKQDDIVHSYEADHESNGNSFTERSLNSFYTKSAESEVEDIIKDIFMIGTGKGTNPGRRKLKYNGAIQTQLSDEDVTLETFDNNTNFETSTYDGDTNVDTVDEDTNVDTVDENTEVETATYDGENTEDSKSKSSKEFSFLSSPLEPSRKKGEEVSLETVSTYETDEKKEDNPLTSALNFMGGKLTETVAALGLDTALSAGSSARSATTSPKESPKSEPPSSGWGILDYASDVLLGGNSEEEANSPSFCDGQGQTSLEEDGRLVDLAVQAAVSMHRLNGYEFDTSQEIDIASEIKFSVVDLKLPLGLIFQENEKGCWVTKILPDGSAARTKADVQIGDQLAAVDGKSAINLTVDQIAKLIRIPKKIIELTFVRYVGPLRPEVGSVMQEEGYEIRATETIMQQIAPESPSSRRKKLSWSPPVSPRQQRTREKASSPEPAPSSSRQTPTKGILKNGTTPPREATASITTARHTPAKATPSASEKKRFRLFGRRKQNVTK